MMMFSSFSQSALRDRNERNYSQIQSHELMFIWTISEPQSDLAGKMICFRCLTWNQVIVCLSQKYGTNKLTPISLLLCRLMVEYDRSVCVCDKCCLRTV